MIYITMITIIAITTKVQHNIADPSGIAVPPISLTACHRSFSQSVCIPGSF